MEKPQSRLLAFLTYLIPVIVPLYVIFGRRKETLARYHAHQSLALVIAAVIVPAVWAIAAWIVVWIPLVGPLLAAASFALVIAAYVVIVYGWITGMYAAVQADIRPAPLFGDWGERFSI